MQKNQKKSLYLRSDTVADGLVPKGRDEHVILAREVLVLDVILQPVAAVYVH